jgi:hypothetical protein
MMAFSTKSQKFSAHASSLRQELCRRNAAYASSRQLPHVASYGGVPVIVYEPSPDLARHGNFIDVTYKVVLGQPEWKRRLEKIHAQASRSLPRRERSWKELDSSMSSDALLMNVFCHPSALVGGALISILGIEIGTVPEFGFKARVPLRSGRTDRTEVDMKLDALLVESKLTESDFQSSDAVVVESYRDLDEVFDRGTLPRVNGQYISYQLIRNVLAAHALKLSFCVLLDARRPDLLEAWYAIMKCVAIPDLRTRCKVLTWQELSEVVSLDLQQYLDLKYGIVPPGRTPSEFSTSDGIFS